MKKENKSDDIVIKLSKWTLDSILGRIRELKNKMDRNPYYYNKEYEVILGKDEYFIMGDNRDHSLDSRAFGPINANDITQKYLFQLTINK